MGKKIFIAVWVFGAAAFLSPLAAQDLTIDYRYNVAGADTNNYLTYKSAIRYIETIQDSYDTATGASRNKSTSLFAPIQTDIMGRATISTGFRGLLLFAVSPDSTTGPIQNDYGDMMAMFNWDGVLEVTFENPILTIKGTLRPVKR